MSEKLLIEEAMRRREIFANLQKYLREIKHAATEVDEKELKHAHAAENTNHTSENKKSSSKQWSSIMWSWRK
ncbi:MAG: hypothetical protein QXF45_07180 [Candidatus Caldarchaeum sp.]